MKVRNVLVLAICVSLAAHCGTQSTNTNPNDSEVSYIPGGFGNGLQPGWADEWANLDDTSVNPVVIGGTILLVSATVVIVGNRALRRLGFEDLNFFHRLRQGERNINLMQNIELDATGRLILRNTDPLAGSNYKAFNSWQFKSRLKHLSDEGYFKTRADFKRHLELELDTEDSIVAGLETLGKDLDFQRDGKHLMMIAAAYMPFGQLKDLIERGAKNSEIWNLYKATGLRRGGLNGGAVKNKFSKIRKFKDLGDFGEAMIASLGRQPGTRGPDGKDFDDFVDNYFGLLRSTDGMMHNWFNNRVRQIDGYRLKMQNEYSKALMRMGLGTDGKTIKKYFEALNGVGDRYWEAYGLMTSGNPKKRQKGLKILEELLERDGPKINSGQIIGFKGPFEYESTLNTKQRHAWSELYRLFINKGETPSTRTPTRRRTNSFI